MSNLYIIATPIGNLEDITLRALRILREEVNTIYCEDTRVTSKLLNYYEIKDKKLVSFNNENEESRIREIERRLLDGENIAICSDAGTPLISDPGLSLISQLANVENFKNFQIVPIPGVSSLTTALSVCPINTERFIYEGFLPHSPQKRRRILRAWTEETRPIVLFESPHRIIKCLEDIKNILGAETQVFVARELTKKFEQLYSGSIDEVQAELEAQFSKEVQGEFVLVINSKLSS